MFIIYLGFVHEDPVEKNKLVWTGMRTVLHVQSENSTSASGISVPVFSCSYF